MPRPVSSQTFQRRRSLLGADRFQFDCHPGLPCFTRCCRDADMYLYPYDIIRLKTRLGVSSDQFLERYTLMAFRDNPYFPSVMLKMTADGDRACPFLNTGGCSVYPDRPFSCRAYPLERAVGRTNGENAPPVCYFMAKDAYCHGHQEARRWTVDEWLDDQQIRPYNAANDLWVTMDTLFRANPWGPQGLESPALKMAVMACFNVDRFKAFIFESTFMQRFQVTAERMVQLKASDLELLKFGFDWVHYFINRSGPLGDNALPPRR